MLHADSARNRLTGIGLISLTYVAFNLMTRKLAAYDSPETIQLLPAVVASAVLAPFALATWESPRGGFEWLLLCLMGAAIVVGCGLYLFSRERHGR